MALHSALTDLSTRIRNGQKARKLNIIVKKTKNGENILKVLKEEGFIRDFLIHANHIQVYLRNTFEMSRQNEHYVVNTFLKWYMFGNSW